MAERPVQPIMDDFLAHVGTWEFPLHVIRNGEQVLAVIGGAALDTLPFSPERYDVQLAASADEVKALVGEKWIPRGLEWSFTAKVLVSLSSSSSLHWIAVRDNGSNKEPPSCASFVTSTTSGALTATTVCEVLQGMSAFSVAHAPKDLTVYIMSEPSKPAVAVSGLASLALPDLLQEPKCTLEVRVLVGDSAEDIINSLGRVASTALSRATLTAADATHVCWPPTLPFPVNVHSCDEERRRREHSGLLLPHCHLLGSAKAIKEWNSWGDLVAQHESLNRDFRKGESWERHLAVSPHLELPQSGPSIPGATTLLTSSSYDYYHYRVDGFKDDGWGCAYRSLQTILSWFQHAALMTETMPSIRSIQEVLYRIDPDKTGKKKFVGSSDWIGSFEIMMVLQHFIPGLECTIRRLESGSELDSDASLQLLLWDHFRQPRAAPVMIGGSSYAHTILGVHININTTEAKYLILDPHYSANPTQVKTAMKKGFIGWKKASSFFEASSWYNLCIPRSETYDPR